jgi:hypothetical protein
MHTVVERSPCIGIQMRLPWGILHMALTHGLMIYYVFIRPETAGEKNALIPPNKAGARFKQLNLNDLIRKFDDIFFLCCFTARFA